MDESTLARPAQDALRTHIVGNRAVTGHETIRAGTGISNLMDSADLLAGALGRKCHVARS